MPEIMRERVFDGAVLTATKNLSSVRAQVSLALRPLLELVNAGFSGTINIQGRISADAAWVNVPYSVFSGGAWGAATAAQLTFATNTATNRYKILDYWPDMQVVMTRSAGTITALDWAAIEYDSGDGGSSGSSSSLSAVATAAAPTYSEGATVSLSTDLAGAQRTLNSYGNMGEDDINYVTGVQLKPAVGAQYAPSNDENWGAATAKNIKTTPGNVWAIRISNINAAVRYFQLHNKATIPLSTEVPQLSFIIPAGTATAPGILQLDETYFVPSEWFTVGIGWAISTTVGTYTAATASEHNSHVRYS